MIQKIVNSKDDMWKTGYPFSDLFLTTTNSTTWFDESIGKDRLIMGAGHAKEFLDRHDGIDMKFADVIKRFSYESQECSWNKREYRVWHNPCYGLIAGSKLGMLQTKYRFWDKSDFWLVSKGVTELGKYAREYPEKRIDLPFPAIGKGGLAVSQILPLLEKHLPDNCYVWRLREDKADYQISLPF